MWKEKTSVTMILQSNVQRNNIIFICCLFSLCSLGLSFESNSHDKDWQRALDILRSRNVDQIYSRKAHSNDAIIRRATCIDKEWFKQSDVIFTVLLQSEKDAKTKLQEAIRKDLKTSNNYPYIASLAALSGASTSAGNFKFVLSTQSILSQRVVASRAEERWNIMYAFEQSVHCGHYSPEEIAEISKLIHSWHKLEFDDNASFQLRHILFSITGQLSGYFKIDEQLKEIEQLWSGGSKGVRGRTSGSEGIGSIGVTQKAPIKTGKE